LLGYNFSVAVWVGYIALFGFAAPIVGGMITSTIHVLILVPVFFLLIKRRALSRGRLTGTPAPVNS
jgi:copper/silver efflux system protein